MKKISIRNFGWWASNSCKDFILPAIVKSDQQKKFDQRVELVKRGSGDVNKVLETYSIQQILDLSDKKLILIEGVPGVGKSTLSWELCRKWEESQKYDLVIHFNLRDDCVQEMTKISDLFLTCKDEGDREYIVERVEKCDGKGVLFVLDGYDELPEYKKEHVLPNINNFQEKGLFRDLISKEKLKESMVIVTSRHSAGNQFNICEIQKYEIRGFTKKNIEDYALKVFSEDKSKFLNYVSKYPIFESAMHIPINVVIIVEIYKENAAKSEEYVLCTSTDLYRVFCCLFFRKFFESPNTIEWEKLVNEEMFIQLCTLAFSGIKHNKLTFCNSDLRDCNKKVCDILDKRPSLGDASYSFPHLTFQEFLAACYISQICDENKVELFRKYEEQRWNVVWNFVAGLTKFTFIDSNNFNRFTFNDSNISPFFFQNLFESQQESFNYFEVENIVYKIEHYFWTPLDAYAAGYCIAKYTKPNKELWKVNIPCEEKLFMQGVCCHASNSTGGIIGSFHVSGLSSNKKSSDYVFLELLNKTIEPFKKVSDFSIKDFFLPMSTLSTIISKMSNLVKLDISDSKVEGDGNKFLHHLSNTNIKELNIKYTGIECFLDHAQGASIDIGSGDLQKLTIGTRKCDTGAGGTHLVHLASSYSSLRHLTIIGFPISTFNTSNSLTELHLIGNDESNFTEDLVRILKETQTLNILDLTDVLFTIPESTDELKKILGALRNCKSLEIIKFVLGCGFAATLAPNMGPDKTVNDDVSDSIVPSIGLNDEVIKALKDMTQEISIENSTRVELELIVTHENFMSWPRLLNLNLPSTVEMSIVTVNNMGIVQIKEVK